MGIKFEHNELRLLIIKELPKLLIGELMILNNLKQGFEIRQKKLPYRTGTGDKEQLWDKHEIIYDKKKVPLTFTENANGKFFIMVDNKHVCSLERKECMTKDKIKSLVQTVKKEFDILDK